MNVVRKFLVFYKCRQCGGRFDWPRYLWAPDHTPTEPTDALSDANVTAIHTCQFGDTGVGDITGVRGVPVEPLYNGGVHEKP